MRYIRLGDGAEATLPTVLSFYQDVASVGTMRGDGTDDVDDAEEVDAVEIELDTGMEDQSQEDNGGGDDAADKEYHTMLAKAIEDIEEFL